MKNGGDNFYILFVGGVHIDEHFRVGCDMVGEDHIGKDHMGEDHIIVGIGFFIRSRNGVSIS